jgi:hypothetical protein
VVTSYLDSVGSIYVEDRMVVGNHAPTPTASTIPVPRGAFALSFMACSTDGETIALIIYDKVLNDPAFGLTVDYDRTFHRDGK